MKRIAPHLMSFFPLSAPPAGPVSWQNSKPASIYPQHERRIDNPMTATIDQALAKSTPGDVTAGVNDLIKGNFDVDLIRKVLVTRGAWRRRS